MSYCRLSAAASSRSTLLRSVSVRAAARARSATCCTSTVSPLISSTCPGHQVAALGQPLADEHEGICGGVVVVPADAARGLRQQAAAALEELGPGEVATAVAKGARQVVQAGGRGAGMRGMLARDGGADKGLARIGAECVGPAARLARTGSLGLCFASAPLLWRGPTLVRLWRRPNHDRAPPLDG